MSGRYTEATLGKDIFLRIGFQSRRLIRPLTPGVGGLLGVEGESVVVAAGDRPDGLLAQRRDLARHRLRLVHDLHRRCSAQAASCGAL